MIHQHTNHLSGETSPYLLQHAHNPVDWYPWGEEALQKAQKENKLIIVSIGYSSCHWCHVMEKESFEDEAVAAIMNDYFISIKVDREERPDIDNIYMTAVQLITRHGGWPLNCIALPDGRPIWGGTYFPKDEWINAITQVHEFYQSNPKKSLEYASSLENGIRQNSVFNIEKSPPEITESMIIEAVEKWSGSFDMHFGGSKGAPKFPLPVTLEFLLQYGSLFSNREVLDFVELTLTRMASGGIYDQVGGGFSRYSVDSEWKVPHFEKMLYDNGQLIGLYSEAWQVFKNEEFKTAVEESVDFLKREMYDNSGLFYSALDADSEGEEGRYYVWKKSELQELLGKEFELFADYYNINNTGYWEDGKYILYRTKSPVEFAAENNFSLEDFIARVHIWKKILLDHRRKRIPPGLDDKSLTSCNAIAISGLLKAYRAFGMESYLKMAVSTADSLMKYQYKKGKYLLRNYKNGIGSIRAFHIDYALLIGSLLDLYQVTMEDKWLKHCLDLTSVTIDRFLDKASGMFNFTDRESEILITNNMEVHDNVIPSSNSVMASNLFRLGRLMVNNDYVNMSLRMLHNISGQFSAYPQAFSNWGRSMLNYVKPFYEIAIVGESAQNLILELMQNYIPNAVIAGTKIDSDRPLFSNRFEDKRTLIFVCLNHTCNLPVENIEDAKKQLHI